MVGSSFGSRVQDDGPTPATPTDDGLFPTLPTALTPLAVPRLRRLLAAQVPADLADWLDLVALGTLLAFHWQLGPTALAGLTLPITLPYVVLGHRYPD